MKKNYDKYIPDWKYIFSKFIEDLKEIKNNIPILVIIIGLLIIPSLYAWFNIKAFWDPYGNTKYLKIAVVNHDKGYTFKNQDIDLGKRVINTLKENDSLDWQFVSMSRAEKGILSGEYFAIIEIPEAFSRDMLSVTKENVRKAKINYTVNEKTNAIAPKITDKGASAIQENISKTFIESVAKTSIYSIGGISNTVGDVKPKLEQMKSTLKKLDTQLSNTKKMTASGVKGMTEIQKTLDNNKSLLPMIKQSVNDSKKLSNDISSTFRAANSNFNSLAPTIKKDIDSTSSLIMQSTDMIESLSDDVSLVVNDSVLILKNARSKIDTAMKINDSVIKAIKRINIINLQLLNKAIENLEEYQASMNNLDRMLSDTITLINNGQQISDVTISNLKSISNELNRKSLQLLSGFDENIRQPIEKITSGSAKITDDINGILSKTDSIYPNINSLISSANNINTVLKTTISVTSSSIDVLQGQIRDAIDAIDAIQNNENYKAFNNVIKSNIMDRVDFFKTPVEINEKKIYKIENYGAAMTPFYSILASWVGGLILISILSTSLGNKDRAIDEYFSKYFLFILLAIIQAIIISLGNFLILGVMAKHPWLFTATLVYCSIVFVTIIYSIVSIFGTVGKGIGVFLLVIQIGGSGGTFPVEMTPSFFRAINSLVPFTYGIEACREAVGGVYLPNLIKDFAILFIMMLVALVFAIFLKESINRLTKPLKKVFENSFIIHH
ncbi:YhgE/Pip domain-containing protein [Peptostreptococcus sp. D1]|uniref:YhgE/Pip domain-containing protein n=1 Tax=Peptostreptococcus sp. D1 TaxID=72304 RepID=UPI0008F20FA2|nr:YhgE/Pip domain-containing protein [Peptostreptococcus sp. D1]SFE43523.1 YhgE/Pip N-terminal domain-containing protein/YhgE/Pip C-terminal domain-containing protein [Peptostreptococcus sp. D1]